MAIVDQPTKSLAGRSAFSQLSYSITASLSFGSDVTLVVANLTPNASQLPVIGNLQSPTGDRL
jgi:hypothetical protein